MKDKSKNKTKWMYAVGVPMLALAMVVLSVPQLNAQEKEEKEAPEKLAMVADVVDLNANPLELENTRIVDEKSTPEDKELMKYMADNIKYPVIALENRVQAFIVVTCDVDGNGKVKNAKIGNVEVEKSAQAHPEEVESLKREALRVVNSISESAMKNSKSTSGKELSFVFRLQGDDVPAFKPSGASGNEVVVVGYAPISKPNINIRGARFEKEKKPLIVVDGVIKDADFDLSSIKPEDIASVNVLKDKSAVDIYGDKGKNGVMIIATKSKGSSPETEGHPLIVVDGKKMAKEFDMKSISPDDVKSMHVFKGDKAIEKYGQEAKDGAIEVTMKK